MITTLTHLAKILALPLVDNEELSDFPLRVPESFVKKIQRAQQDDPLLLQVLPQAQENQVDDGFVADPLAELKITTIPGLIHRYYGRVLLQVTSECAINCRFCFRRHVRNRIVNWQEVLNYIGTDQSISEVILSGGDPLILLASELKKIVDGIAKIPHIKRLRVHSRVPVVMPELFTADLLHALTSSRLQLLLIIHCNHPNEIDDEVSKLINTLLQNRVIILNQSVLLRKINDDAATLVALSEKLYSIGILPYYLHLLDKVKGASHFYVTEERAKQLLQTLQETLPGYLVPKLVVDIAGKLSKKNITI